MVCGPVEHQRDFGLIPGSRQGAGCLSWHRTPALTTKDESAAWPRAGPVRDRRLFAVPMPRYLRSAKNTDQPTRRAKLLGACACNIVTYLPRVRRCRCIPDLGI